MRQTVTSRVGFAGASLAGITMLFPDDEDLLLIVIAMAMVAGGMLAILAPALAST